MPIGRRAERHPAAPIIPDEDDGPGESGGAGSCLELIDDPVLIALGLAPKLIVQRDYNEVDTLLTDVSHFEGGHWSSLSGSRSD